MVDLNTKDEDIFKGEVIVNYQYSCLIKWPRVAHHRKLEDIQQNTIVSNAMLKHRNDIENWLEDNCKHSYKMPSDMTLEGIPVLFVNKEDLVFCCANWDIFTKEDVKPKGSLGVDADGNIVAY